MYQIFKDQLEKSKLIISGVKRNQRLGRDAGVEESVMQKMEEDCKRLEAISAEIDKLHDPVLLPGESHGRRSLVDCSPWGR